MFGKNKEKIKTSEREPTREEIFDYISKDVIGKAGKFLVDESQTYVELLDTDMPHMDSAYTPYTANRLKPEQLSALVDALYIGYSAENPEGNIENWDVKDITRPDESIKVDRYTAVSPTPFGFDIVQTRSKIRDDDSSQLPELLKGTGFLLQLKRK